MSDGSDGNGRARLVLMGAALAVSTSMAGWALGQVVVLKERTVKNEAEVRANHNLLTGISEDVRIMRQDIKVLLQQRK